MRPYGGRARPGCAAPALGGGLRRTVRRDARGRLRVPGPLRAVRRGAGTVPPSQAGGPGVRRTGRPRPGDDPRLGRGRGAAAGGARAGVPAWVSYSAAGGRTRAGQPLEDAFALAARADEVIAVGVNCCTPEDADHAVSVAARVTDKPVVVYPNSGERWDARARAWAGEPTFSASRVTGWRDAGARLIGGAAGWARRRSRRSRGRCGGVGRLTPLQPLAPGPSCPGAAAWYGAMSAV